MNIIQKGFKKVKNAITGTTTSEEMSLQQLVDFLNLHGVDGKALSEATYFSCLKVLSEAVGKLPLKLLQYNDRNGVVNARQNPLYDILKTRPNPYMTSTTFWSTIEYNRNHYGNAYALINGAGSKMTLWVLESSKVTILNDNIDLFKKGKNKIYYAYSGSNGVYTFSADEILHFKTSHTFDGITGLSVKDQLKLTIDSNNRAQKLLNTMYKNGFTAKATLEYTGSLSDENAKKFMDGLEAYAKSDGDNVRSMIPLPLGSKLTPLNVTLADNQFIEVKKYTALQIASAFGIKPYQIGDYDKSSYASAEAQQLSFYVDTLLYILKQYEEELSYKLLSQEDRQNGLHFKFNVGVILRADLKTQVDTLSKAVSSFIYTPNEARAYLDMEARDGGDKLLGNGAYIPVELTGSQYTQNVNNEGKEVNA